MSGRKRDLVHVHITDDLPIRAQALPYADRVEIRLGNAFPIALIIDYAALGVLERAIQQGWEQLNAAGRDEGGSDAAVR
ncbi:hypothetical protein GCM10010174_35020 [Kutzneria viridogrisea]|uniref:Uncharacterized protein n=1 Tax=Kutzneria viridogrisea TaxID=47990 RepID=A0ABR6BLE3_9PSEU|nr:hypothetical protein [Kutzneria viridogrisea]